MKKMKNIIILIVAILLTACGTGAKTWQEHYDLGMRYLSEGNYEEAILSFTAAIDIDPNKIEAYIGLADVYHVQELYDEEINVLIEAYRIEENDEIQKRIEGILIKSEKYVNLNTVGQQQFNYSVDGIAIGDSLTKAKQAYSGRADYMSNTMGDAPDYNDYDTVYSMPFEEGVSFPHTENTFGYFFSENELGGPIEFIYISCGFPNNNFLCMNQFYTESSALDVFNYFGLKETWEGIPNGEYKLLDDGGRYLKVIITDGSISQIMYGEAGKAAEIDIVDNKFCGFTVTTES